MTIARPRQVLVSCLVFVAALLPRLFYLGAKPFWLDEALTLNRASMSPGALVRDSFANHHMPSFFLLLSPLIGLGNPQFWLRVPSAVFGAAAVMLVYLIGSRIAGRMAGLIAALVIGLSPTALAFSQEARSYSMEMCLILIALYGIVMMAADIPGASRSWRDPASARLAWALFVLGSVAAIDVLGDGLPWVLTANIIGGVLASQSTARRQLILNFLYADLLIIACSAPLYAIMLTTVHGDLQSGLMWIPPLSFSRFWFSIGSIYLMRLADSVTFNLIDPAIPVVLVWLMTVGLVMAVICGMWRLRQRSAMLMTLVVSCAFLPVLLTVISLWRPMLLPRYILWSAAPFAVLAGVGASWLIQTLPRRAQIFAFGAAAMLLVANLLPYYGAETKPRWDLAAQLLSQDVAPGDFVLLDDPGAWWLLHMYLPPGSQTAVLGNSDWNFTHAEQAQLKGKRIWVVYGHAGQGPAPPEEWAQFYAKMAPFGTPRQIQLAGNRIYITMFDPVSHGVNCTIQPPLASAAPAITASTVAVPANVGNCS